MVLEKVTVLRSEATGRKGAMREARARMRELNPWAWSIDVVCIRERPEQWEIEVALDERPVEVVDARHLVR